jgi:peroxiredoxin
MDRSNRLFAAVIAAAASLALACGVSAATVGEAAPGFTLTDLHGARHSLADYRGHVVVLEWINPKCPFSERHAREKTMVNLEHDNDVVWLAINSTNPERSDYLTPAAHRAYNSKYGIDYPVLYDPTGEVGHTYDAKTTPHMFVIGEDGTLLYEGAIDDDPLGREKPKHRTNYVEVGLDEHGAGQPVEPATTKPYGCSVKY